MSKTAEELYQKREKRINDAMELREPDLIPVVCLSGWFPARYSGFTFKEVMYDMDKASSAWEKYMMDFQPELASSPFQFQAVGEVLDALDCKQAVWAGHGLGNNSAPQYVEGEYMTADEYDEMIYDPTDFIMRKYWPRIFGILKPFDSLPPFRNIMNYVAGVNFAAFGSQEMITALESLADAAKKARRVIEGSMAWSKRCRELGFPPMAGGRSQAPYDTLSDFFRGMRGAMLDMYRQPDKMIELMDKLMPMMLKNGLAAKDRGCPRVRFAVHRGIDGFMSPEQFEKFYWRYLKELILGLIDGGCNPVIFWEGDVGSRLELIGDIPRGKAIYEFEKTDLFKAKEIIGDTVCIKGGMPLSILMTGTPDDVREHGKKMIDVVGKGGGFIMASSTTLDDAKVENVKAMFDFTREYSIYG